MDSVNVYKLNFKNKPTNSYLSRLKLQNAVSRLSLIYASNYWYGKLTFLGDDLRNEISHHKLCWSWQPNEQTHLRYLILKRKKNIRCNAIKLLWTKDSAAWFVRIENDHHSLNGDIKCATVLPYLLSLSVVSVTCYQLKSENFRWKIPEINHS